MCGCKPMQPLAFDFKNNKKHSMITDTPCANPISKISRRLHDEAFPNKFSSFAFLRASVNQLVSGGTENAKPDEQGRYSINMTFRSWV